MRRAISTLYAFRTSDQNRSRYRRSSSRPSRRTESTRRLPRGSTRPRPPTQWQQTRSTNIIRSTIDGCVTREDFENVAPQRWTGMSVIVNHMVFHDVAQDSLVWDWEASRDAGRTWELIWSVTYRRR